MDVRISSLPAGAKAILQDNPFYVLGIGCLSTLDDAAKKDQEIKKLESLHVVASYNKKTKFNLSGIESPERSVPRFQEALERMKEEQYRWLWFVDSKIEHEGIEYQLEDNWRDIAKTNLNNSDCYDVFLVHLLVGLLEDPTFSDHKTWDDIFSYIQNVIIGNRTKLEKRGGADYTDLEKALLNVFQCSVFNLDKCCLGELYRYINSFSYNNELMENIKKCITREIFNWIESAVKPVEELDRDLEKKYPSAGIGVNAYCSITDDEARTLVHVMSDFFARYWNVFKSIECSLPDGTDIKDSVIKKTIEYVNYSRVKLQHANKGCFVKEAGYFYSLIINYYAYLYPEDYEYNWRDGFEACFLDVPQEVFIKLINTGKFEGYRYLFDRYQEIDDYKNASKIMKEAYECYSRFGREQKEIYYNHMVYMLLAADLYGDQQGVEIFIKEFDSSFPYFSLTDKEKQYEYGRMIVDLEPSKKDIVGWYWLMRAFKAKNKKNMSGFGDSL